MIIILSHSFAFVNYFFSVFFGFFIAIFRLLFLASLLFFFVFFPAFLCNLFSFRFLRLVYIIILSCFLSTLFFIFFVLLFQLFHNLAFVNFWILIFQLFHSLPYVNFSYFSVFVLQYTPPAAPLPPGADLTRAWPEYSGLGHQRRGPLHLRSFMTAMMLCFALWATSQSPSQRSHSVAA